MTDKQRPKRWVCREMRRDTPVEFCRYVEIVGNAVPEMEEGGWWKSPQQKGMFSFNTYAPHSYERLTGIHLEPGEGPIELDVRVKGDESGLSKGDTDGTE